MICILAVNLFFLSFTFKSWSRIITHFHLRMFSVSSQWQLLLQRRWKALNLWQFRAQYSSLIIQSDSQTHLCHVRIYFTALQLRKLLFDVLQVNHIFDHLEVTRHFNGPVLFTEDDHLVSADFIHTLMKMYRFRERYCHYTNIYNHYTNIYNLYRD